MKVEVVLKVSYLVYLFESFIREACVNASCRLAMHLDVRDFNYIRYTSQGRVKGGGTPGTVPGGPLRIWGPLFFKANFLK